MNGYGAGEKQLNSVGGFLDLYSQCNSLGASNYFCGESDDCQNFSLSAGYSALFALWRIYPVSVGL